MEVFMRYLAVLLATLVHLGAVAQEGEGSIMNVDPHRINEKLREFTVQSSTRDSIHFIPRGLLLRGAFRLHNIGNMATSTAGAADSSPTLNETSAPAENFVASRSINTILEACSMVSSNEKLSEADLVSAARLFSLAEEIEQEELEAFYEGLIEQLPPSEKREVDELVTSASRSMNNARLDMNYTRLDWLALVTDSPDVAEFLIRHACANRSRLTK
jgi:hypothetical protein